MTSLRRKFLIGTAVGLTALSLALLVLVAALYQHQLSQERSLASREINHLLQAALENAMLKRDLPGLRDVVDRLGRQEGVRNAMILAPDGEIRFASDPALIGQRFPLSDRDVCPDCLDQTGARALPTLFTRDIHGREVMRSLNPVRNKPACAGCHGSPEARPLNGVLVVDYDAAPIRHKAVVSAATLGGMGGLLLAVTLLSSAWFIRRHILQPVSCLAEASRALSDGRLDSRVTLDGNDELANLGNVFNRMAANLQDLIRRTREQEAFLQALVDAIPDGIRVIDTQTFRIVLDNQAYRDQLALPEGMEARGLTCHASSHGRDTPCPASLATCPIYEIGRSGKPLKTLMEFNRHDGRKTKVEVFAAPMQAHMEGQERRYIVESSRDLHKVVTFSQEQRLAEMARLATGVAHEIHNPLTSIRIALQATLRATQQEPERYAVFRDYLELVDGEIDRCIDVTERLLKLGMRPPETPQLVDVNRAVRETLSLEHWEIAERGVELGIQWLEPSPRVLASDTELRLVALNLIQNALHAMPKGGRLHVSTSIEGGWARIAIADTGVGIREHDAARIFEPFYSHRADGVNGTGLGLSICKAVVEGYGGRIEFASQPGVGSCFYVLLPQANHHTHP
ncbi:MAG TPA: ATP-binding protein [Thiobacillaceae bacterium]|nr:ATP-binding protein [Thiobacillaceae bacterium]